MALKHYKPTTPGTRGLTLIDHSELHKGAPEKSLTVGLKSKGGRNNFGHVTVPHQGGGHKRKYRLIDFDRQKKRYSCNSGSFGIRSKSYCFYCID